jgi:hypothetical protein
MFNVPTTGGAPMTRKVPTTSGGGAPVRHLGAVSEFSAVRHVNIANELHRKRKDDEKKRATGIKTCAVQSGEEVLPKSIENVATVVELSPDGRLRKAGDFCENQQQTDAKNKTIRTDPDG